MAYAIKLHIWLRSLGDMYADGKMDKTTYLESVDSVWNIAQVIGEKENLEKLCDEYYG